MLLQLTEENGTCFILMSMIAMHFDGGMYTRTAFSSNYIVDGIRLILSLCISELVSFARPTDPAVIYSILFFSYAD